MAKKNLEALCAATGLRLDLRSGAAYGVYRGYHVSVTPPAQSNGNVVHLAFSVSRNGGAPDLQALRELRNECREIVNVSGSGSEVVFTVHPALNWNKTLEQTEAALNAAAEQLRRDGYQDCCQRCGSTEELTDCVLSGRIVHVCGACAQSLMEAAGAQQQKAAQKPENALAGAVGALLGSLIGAAVIVILSRLGIVAAISGLVMAICTLKGYELLGGRLSKKGVVISVLLMLVMVYFGDRCDWAFVIAKELEADFFTSFQAVPALLEMEVMDAGVYWSNLLMVYLFAIIGAVPTIINSLRSSAQQNNAYVLR